LAISAPAQAGHNRRLRALPADRSAEASTCCRHGVCPANEAKRTIAMLRRRASVGKSDERAA
jgi:hypothetical protein